jgi:hypothetical protein
MLVALALSGCSGHSPVTTDVQGIAFQTQAVPPADAGRLYNVVIGFTATGGAALPDRFELIAGVLPTGVTLDRDREDLNLDGIPDEDGAFTGNARLLGVPRQRGSYSFTVKAISTGDLTGSNGQPDLAATQPFSVNVGEGAIAILTPTAEEGTSDPAVPAFPNVVPFVNPANPEAFFAFPFLIAGGSNNNVATIYGPREWELSSFDNSVDTSIPATLRMDVDETAVPGAPANLSSFEQNIADGGIFVLQAGQQKVQLGGFQSPRGPVREDGPDAGEDITAADPAFMGGLLPIWFQDAIVPKNSRRDLADTLQLSGGDNTLGTASPVLFSDYFNPGFKSTTPPFAAKYPFTADQYLNAFFVTYTAGTDLTPLSYRLIVEAIDTRGTPANRLDDVIARKAFIVRVQIPDIKIDTIQLPSGQAGVLYTAQIALTGGVPPLFTDLEYVDGTSDLTATAGDPLVKANFGVELDPTIWRFIGAPRAAAPDTVPGTPTPDGPVVELSVRAWAQVMNPVQASAAQIPTGGVGEFDGTSAVTGKKGRHKTYPINVALPTLPVVANVALAAGIDGVAYPGDRVTGSGGVPLLAPNPVGFFDSSPGAVYPSASAQRSYRWSSSYILDESHPDPTLAGMGYYPGPANDSVGETHAGLPYNLSLVTSETVATNGNISGTPNDRGYHPTTISGLDFYIGLASAPNLTTFQQVFQRVYTISVSPDTAVYMRGVATSEGTGGKANGLNADDQMTEQRMVPMLLAAGLFSVETGKTPVRFAGMPTNFDTLPLLLPNGGTDSHNQMSVPQVRGFWPAEANKETQFNSQTTATDEGWSHLQQEFTWLQSPDASQSRVFLWAEATKVGIFNSGTWNQRFQQMDLAKKRGVLVLNPVTGKVHVPAILDPASEPDAGVLFGAEYVLGCRSNTYLSAYIYNYYEGSAYTKGYYYAVEDSQHDRQAHMHGGGVYLQAYSTTQVTSTGGGWYMRPLGRTATSVAMSADGKWCATALVGQASLGANQQKFLLWRTDNQPIPAAFLGQSFIEGVPWVDEAGTAHLATDNPRAVIVKVGGQVASTTTITANQRFLLPDSLMFVEGGLLFLNESQLQMVFGMSLLDGHLSSINLNTRVAVNGAGTGPTVDATYGQFVPDTDKLVAGITSAAHGVQFSFAGNKPAAGTTGPKRVAFVAGTMNLTSSYNETSPYSSSYPGPSGGYVGALSEMSASSWPRQGYSQNGNANKSLIFMDLTTTGGSLELSTSTLRDLTGNSAAVYGDLLTPGRFGENLDRLVLSDDGNYAAVVRDVSVGGYLLYNYYGYYGGFATAYYYYIIGPWSSYAGWLSSHNLLLVSTSGADMSSSTGTTHVLFLGAGQHGPSGSTASAKGGMPTYAVQQTHINGSVSRIYGLNFSADGERLIMTYAAHNNYIPTGGYPFGTNWQPWSPSYTSQQTGYEVSLSLRFRQSGAATDFTSTSVLTNNLNGLTGTSTIGTTTMPIGNTNSQQDFWATFKSFDGRFIYYISDQIDTSLTFTAANRNFLVGFNTTATNIGSGTALSPTRAPYTPFSPHSANIGFEQFDCNCWNYESRFAASPGGIASPAGPDAKGILCMIASDASAGAGSATDLEVYVMNANLGTPMFALTSAVTTGTANAINHLYLSCDGNMLAGQISKTATTSGNTRATLNNNSDLFVVRNIHAVLAGATPSAIILSTGQSHGSSVAFVGDGTPAGPQALIYSSATASSSNSTWASRTLKSIFLAAGAIPSQLDNTQSVYSVLAGGRTINDIAANGN